MISSDKSTASDDGGADNSTKSADFDDQDRVSDYKNEDEQMQILEQIVEENAEKTDTAATDHA